MAAKNLPAEGTPQPDPESRSLSAQASAAAGLPAGLADDLAAFAGIGMENVAATDLLVPRLAILQALSPQVDETAPEFIAGAKNGDIADVGLGRVIGREVHFLPVYYKKQWLEWAPRSTGQGLQAIHETSDIMNQTSLNEKKKPVLPNGNLIVETAQFFGFLMGDDGSHRPVFIPMASTQLKKSRKLLTLADEQRIPGANYKAPLFWAVYKLGTVPESNGEGKWVGWTVQVETTLPQFRPDNWRDIMTDCKKFVSDLHTGEARADMSGIDGNEGGITIDAEGNSEAI